MWFAWRTEPKKKRMKKTRKQEERKKTEEEEEGDEENHWPAFSIQDGPVINSNNTNTRRSSTETAAWTRVAASWTVAESAGSCTPTPGNAVHIIASSKNE